MEIEYSIVRLPLTRFITVDLTPGEMRKLERGEILAGYVSEMGRKIFVYPRMDTRLSTVSDRSLDVHLEQWQLPYLETGVYVLAHPAEQGDDWTTWVDILFRNRQLRDV